MSVRRSSNTLGHRGTKEQWNGIIKCFRQKSSVLEDSVGVWVKGGMPALSSIPWTLGAFCCSRFSAIFWGLIVLPFCAAMPRHGSENTDYNPELSTAFSEVVEMPFSRDHTLHDNIDSKPGRGIKGKEQSCAVAVSALLFFIVVRLLWKALAVSCRNTRVGNRGTKSSAEGTLITGAVHRRLSSPFSVPDHLFNGAPSKGWKVVYEELQVDAEDASAVSGLAKAEASLVDRNVVLRRLAEGSSDDSDSDRPASPLPPTETGEAFQAFCEAFLDNEELVFQAMVEAEDLEQHQGGEEGEGALLSSPLPLGVVSTPRVQPSTSRSPGSAATSHSADSSSPPIRSSRGVKRLYEGDISPPESSEEGEAEEEESVSAASSPESTPLPEGPLAGPPFQPRGAPVAAASGVVPVSATVQKASSTSSPVQGASDLGSPSGTRRRKTRRVDPDASPIPSTSAAALDEPSTSSESPAEEEAGAASAGATAGDVDEAKIAFYMQQLSHVPRFENTGDLRGRLLAVGLYNFPLRSIGCNAGRSIKLGAAEKLLRLFTKGSLDLSQLELMFHLGRNILETARPTVEASSRLRAAQAARTFTVAAIVLYAIARLDQISPEAAGRDHWWRALLGKLNVKGALKAQYHQCNKRMLVVIVKAQHALDFFEKGDIPPLRLMAELVYYFVHLISQRRNVLFE